MEVYDLCIVTGWSNIGGSTEAYVNLTNALNADGVKTVLIGPHEYHKSLCDGVTFAEFGNYSAKNLIWHFANYPKQMKGKMFGPDSNQILSCHESNTCHIYERYGEEIKAGYFDHFHFVSEPQLEYQLSKGGGKREENMVIIPNLLDPKLSKDTISQMCSGSGKKIGAVIGSIDPFKRTHDAICDAIKDGCDEIRLFGNAGHPEYFFNYIKPHLDSEHQIRYYGIERDKNVMYLDVTDVYQCSERETWSYTKAECEYLGINFHSQHSYPAKPVEADDIIKQWKEILI